MDNVNQIQQALLLAVLGTPLLAALLCAVFGGRVAAALAAAHVGLTALMAMLVLGVAGDRGDAGPHRAGLRVSAAQAFRPTSVPGDPGVPGLADSVSHGTAWGVLALGPKSPAGVPDPDVQFYVGVDGLNVWLVALTSVMTLVAVLVSVGRVRERPGAYFAWLFALQAAATGAFLSFDVVLFYVFFELTLVPAFFLIGDWGPGRGRRDAAKLFFLYTLFGSLLTLVGLVGVVLANPTPLHPTDATPRVSYGPFLDAAGKLQVPTAGPLTFSIPNLMRNASTWGLVRSQRRNFTQVKLGEAVDRSAEADASSLPSGL